ncbi:CooT family nickel-binding protein [Thiovibrio sp. JS02]
MCQMSIILEQDGKEEVFLENASFLEVTEEGVRVSALFEEPRLIKGGAVRSVDFLKGRVTVTKTGGTA